MARRRKRGSRKYRRRNPSHYAMAVYENPMTPGQKLLTIGAATVIIGGIAYWLMKPKAAASTPSNPSNPTGPSTVTIGPANAGQTINLKVGDRLSIQLPYTKGQWDWTYDVQGSSLTSQNSDLVVTNNSWTDGYTASSPGTTTIKYAKMDAQDVNQIEPTMTFTIVVS